MIYSIDEISDLIFLSRNTIRERIKLLGLVSQRKDSTKTYYFDEEQIELIKENNCLNYESNLRKNVIVIF